MNLLESSMRPHFKPKSYLAILGATFLAGVTAVPAKAEVHQIGSVNVAADHYTDISWEHFEGPVERLQFVADGDTVDCAHINVTYRDGTTHTVFSGIMPKDSIETVTFRKVTVACGTWISPARPRA
jgi:hypothetical protein